MTLGDQLRTAIEGSGLSLNAVSRETGIDYASLYHFYTRGANIRIGTADAIAEYFGMHLTRPRKVEAPPDRRRKGGK